MYYHVFKSSNEERCGSMIRLSALKLLKTALWMCIEVRQIDTQARLGLLCKFLIYMALV